MKIRLEEKNNKMIVGVYPGVLDEIKNNVRELKNLNESVVAPSKKEQKIIPANKKYIKAIEQILPFSEKALEIMQNYHTDVTDNNAMLFIFKGVISYTNNRFNELERTRKSVNGEKFFFHDDNKRVMLAGLEGREDDKEKTEDLSYVFSNLYRDQEALLADTSEAVKKSDDALKWLTACIKSSEHEKFDIKTKQRFDDLVANGSFVYNTGDIMNKVRKSMKTEEDFKICQGLFANYNTFLKRLYTDCWAFKVDNNL